MVGGDHKQSQSDKQRTVLTRGCYSLPQRHLPPFHLEHLLFLQPFFLFVFNGAEVRGRSSLC
jgi:hypothetical protein